MFDYQAGEKYRLTLIMVGVAGLLAGIFFTMLLMPTESPASSRRKVAMTRAMSDPDVTGGRGYSAPNSVAQAIAANVAGPMQGGGGAGGASAAPAGQLVDRGSAKIFMDQWLPRVWDLGCQSASQAQEWAISQMTPACAAAYRSNIWTPALSKQVQESGLQSTFTPSTVDVSENLADGSVVVKVKGVQILSAATGQQKQRVINVEYMVIQTPEGMKVAGISEGQSH